MVKGKPGTLLSIWLAALLSTLLFLVASPPAQAQDAAPARVRFALPTTTGTTDVDVRIYKSNECDDEHKLTSLQDHYFLRHARRERLGLPLWDFHENGANEFVLPAQPLFVMMEAVQSIGLSDATCAVFVSANLASGTDYEFAMIFPRVTLPYPRYPFCEVRMSQIVASGAAFERRLVHTFDNRVNSEGCEDAFHRLRWW